jgi:hypothetical protein
LAVTVLNKEAIVLQPVTVPVLLAMAHHLVDAFVI